MPTTNINVRADSEMKSKAQEIFSSLGLDISTAINMFLRQTVRQNDLPFVPTTNVKHVKKTREVMFGCLREEYRIADDFVAPLDDFTEYMECSCLLIRISLFSYLTTMKIFHKWPEIAIKHSLGKLPEFKGGVKRFFYAIHDTPIEIVGVLPEYIKKVEELPYIHRDPFDRLIIATALCGA